MQKKEIYIYIYIYMEDEENLPSLTDVTPLCLFVREDVKLKKIAFIG